MIRLIELLRRQPIPASTSPQLSALRAITVSRLLKRLGISKLKDIEPAEPVRRYESDRPGELIDINIGKLARSIAPVIASPATVPDNAAR